MVSRVQADQAEQDVLTARVRIEEAALAYDNALDQFKITLGVPVSTDMQLDSAELAALAPRPLPMDEAKSVETALHVRPDVLKDFAKVRDALVDVDIAADQFNPLLNVSVGTAVPGKPPTQAFSPQFQNWTRFVNVQFDYPLDQTDNRDIYRRSLIDADKAKRDSDEFLDTVRLNVRSDYRALTTLERSYEIQRLSVDLAGRRTQLARFEQKEGLATTRDVLDAEDSLRSSKNAMIASLVGYYTQRLAFLANLGMIRVDAQGKYYERNEPFYFDRPSRFP
jgi:outer membrane protein TolC